VVVMGMSVDMTVFSFALVCRRARCHTGAGAVGSIPQLAHEAGNNRASGVGSALDEPVLVDLPGYRHCHMWLRLGQLQRVDRLV